MSPSAEAARVMEPKVDVVMEVEARPAESVVMVQGEAKQPVICAGPVQVMATGSPAMGVMPSDSVMRTAKADCVPVGSVPEGAATSAMMSGAMEVE